MRRKNESSLQMIAPGYCSTAEAAERLGTLQSSISHLLISGKLRGIKLYRDWLVEMESIEEYDRELKGPHRGRPRKHPPRNKV